MPASNKARSATLCKQITGGRARQFRRGVPVTHHRFTPGFGDQIDMITAGEKPAAIIIRWFRSHPAGFPRRRD